MAKFTDVSNELVIAIASHIRKPADILNLCIAERRSHDIILPLLYEKITLHHPDYSTPQSLKSSISTLCQLFKQQKQNNKTGNGQSVDFGAECRYLSINILNNMRRPSPNVHQLLGFLPFLRNLSLIISRRPIGYSPDFGFGMGNLGRALHPMRHTLETLTLFIGSYEGAWSRSGIGSLHLFTAMKQLHIQSHILIGYDYAHTTVWNSNVESGSLLSRTLPPNLEKIAIHCCEIEWMFREGEIAHHLEGASFENAARCFGSGKWEAGKEFRVIRCVAVCRLQEPKNNYSSCVTASRLPRLARCFDIVGESVDSADGE